MSDLATFITVAAAMAFTCAAFFLFGQTIGLGNVGLFSQYTFGDVVDAAPSSILSMAVVLISSIWTGEKERSALEQSVGPMVPISLARWKDIVKAAVASVVIIVPCFFVSHAFGIAIFVTVVAVMAFYARLLPYLYNRLKRTTAGWIERWFWAAVIMFIWGCNSSSPALLAPGNYTVKTTTKTVSAAKVLQLDRGVIIVEQNGFDLIPWEQVQSVSYRLMSKGNATSR